MHYFLAEMPLSGMMALANKSYDFNDTEASSRGWSAKVKWRKVTKGARTMTIFRPFRLAQTFQATLLYSKTCKSDTFKKGLCLF